MAEAEMERRGYHRLAARGHVGDEEVTAALSDLDEARETAEREPKTARARGEAIRRLEQDRDALMEPYGGTVGESLEDLSPEERHRVYEMLRLEVRFRLDWPLEISGIFAEVAEEDETALSYRNPSPRSV
jgi:hypothetical protein